MIEFLGMADWNAFVPAVQAFLHGQNPYLTGSGSQSFYNPFWTLIFLIPFVLLPEHIGRVAMFVVSYLCFAYTAKRMEANLWQLALFLISINVIGGIYDGNIDWLATMGFWMPPTIGLFFVLMKPQLGFGIALFWLYICWKQGGLKKVFITFAPVTLAFLFSILLYGFWIRKMFTQTSNSWNFSAFPYTIPMGLILLYFAIKEHKKELSLPSSLLLTPYTSPHSYSSLLIGLFNRPKLFIISWVALWIPIVVRLIVLSFQ